MQGYIRNDKNYQAASSSSSSDEEESQQHQELTEAEKDKKIKRLTQINKELIETLKQQNQQLTKKIQKQKLKGGRSFSHKSSPKNNSKQLQSIRKELSNAYKQIDMYKDVVQNLKTKQISLDSVDKMHEMDNKIKAQDAIIEGYQKELRYLAQLKEKQDKELKVYQNDDVKMNKIMVEKQITQMKEKIKSLKKNATKRSEIEKRQHAYFVELEKAVRKANDEYYPGKVQAKKQTRDEEISDMEWNTVKSKLAQLRKLYQENNKKLDMINRQKLRQLKSYEENQLKLKEKSRKLTALKNRIAELTKLTVAKKGQQLPKEPLPKKSEVKNDKNKTGPDNDRAVKRWNVPESFHLEMGKVLPNSNFISDKSILDSGHKYKIVEAFVFINGTGVPCSISFTYESQTGQRVQGRDLVQNMPQNLDMKTFSLQEKDYIWKISGSFKDGVLSAITLKSKLGKEEVFEDENFRNSGDAFTFYPKTSQCPSCFYGATIRTSDDVKICYLGFEFSN